MRGPLELSANRFVWIGAIVTGWLTGAADDAVGACGQAGSAASDCSSGKSPRYPATITMARIPDAKYPRLTLNLEPVSVLPGS